MIRIGGHGKELFHPENSLVALCKTVRDSELSPSLPDNGDPKQTTFRAPANAKRMEARMTVERILKVRGSHVPTVGPEALISDVIAALESEDTGALVVSADGEHIDGIISERDVVRSLRQIGPAALQNKVRDIMTSNVLTCTADDRVAGVMALMDDQNIRHVPVVEKGKIAGMVSIRDIVKLRLGEVQSEADAMRAYISG